MAREHFSLLKTLKGKKQAIVVVGGGSMKQGFGFDKVVSYLKEAGMEVQLFEGVEPPISGYCQEGKAAMTESLDQTDCINRRRISNRCSEGYVGIL